MFILRQGQGPRFPGGAAIWVILRQLSRYREALMSDGPPILERQAAPRAPSILVPARRDLVSKPGKLEAPVHRGWG